MYFILCILSNLTFSGAILFNNNNNNKETDRDFPG